MLIHITGGCKNGKTDYAQKLCCDVSPKGKRIYIAVMVPSDDEDLKRIRIHRKDREKLGFITAECGNMFHEFLKDPCSFLDMDQSELSECSCLLDSTTALLMNMMFVKPLEEERESSFSTRIIEDIWELESKVKLLAVISDGIYSDSVIYDEYTQKYRRALAMTDRKIAGIADETIEITAGREVRHEMTVIKRRSDESMFVTGGAFQGKTDFIVEELGIKKEDIFDCSGFADPKVLIREVENLASDKKGGRCIKHLERYIYACCIQQADPVNDFPNGTVLCGNDIFCGVVPIDATERKYREVCGRYYQKIASKMRTVRVFCGIATELVN